MIKVVQAVHGTFHHFDLARQLHRHGMLEAIFTGYPRWKLKNEALPPEKIKTFPWLRTLIMAQGRLGIELPRRLNRQLDWWAALSLDSYVASRLPGCNVFVALSGGGLKTAGLVKSRGGRYICDRGSAHIRYVEKLLRDEFARWGQVFPEIDPRAVAREESEYANSDVITIPSEFCVRSFVEMGVPVEKLRRIPYGVDVSRFRKVTDPPRDSFEVLFVGAVSFQKGVPYLLEAFKRLRHPHKRLRVVGGMGQEMKKFLRDNARNSVEFVGPVPQSELIPIMSSSHVMVLPSVQDGFGLVLGQAMACGCPVICSTNTGGADLIGGSQAGYVFPTRDVTTLVARLEELCQDSHLRNRMSGAALEKVKQLGGWDNYGNQFARLCSELSAQKN